MKDQHEVIEQPGHPAEAEHQKEFISFEAQVLILTWVTFLIVLVILQKYAWKPILAALDAREESIRKSVDEADRIHKELQELDAKKEEILRKADDEARAILSQARQAAREAAKVIEQKTREESQILLDNARREIKSDLAKAREELKVESARIAVTLAEKILDRNLSDKANREFVDSLIQKI